jgi:endonuclease YncB( thermonuclease family)
MLWRPLALFLSIGLASVATLALWGYLIAAHDLPQVGLLLILCPAFALLSYCVWRYLLRSRSLRGVLRRAGSAFKMGAFASLALFGLWVVSLLYGLGDTTAASVLVCDDCALISVTRVIDGDTLVSNGQRIRLFGIDAPEAGERCAEGATDRLRQLAGDRVRIEGGPRSTDRFGRRLGYMYTEDGFSIDELMVAEGHAVAWNQDGQYKDFLVREERRARDTGTGCLW